MLKKIQFLKNRMALSCSLIKCQLLNIGKTEKRMALSVKSKKSMALKGEISKKSMALSVFAKNRMALSVFLLSFGVLFGASAQADSTKYTANYDNVDIREFIDSIGRIMDKTFLVDSRVAGKVNIKSKKQLTKAELYQVFLTQLRMAGFATVDLDKNRTKVVSDQAIRMEALPLAQAGRANADIMQTAVIRLNNVDANHIVNVLSPLIDRRISVITQYPPTNLLIITDWGNNLNRLTKIISQMDYSSKQPTEVLMLKHASASELQKIISQLLNSQKKGSQIPMVLADDRANALIVRTDPALMADVKQLVGELDNELPGSSNTQVVYLRHAKAKEVVAVLNKLSKTTATGKAGAGLIPLTFEAHESTNAIVMQGEPDKLRNYKTVIAQLDIRRAQVVVETIIAEISDSNVKEFGLQWLFADPKTNVPIASTSFGNSGLPINSLAAGLYGGATAKAGLAGLLSGVQGITAGLAKFSGGNLAFASLLRALNNETSFHILSTPTILTMDNAEASILVGQEVPFITGTTKDKTSGSPFQTIQRKEIGIKLTLTPQINDDNTIRLEIKQEVSSIEDSVKASDIITNKREIKTTVLAEDQSIIILGGLISTDVGNSVNKVPFLGDVPILGNLFSHKAKTTTKRNLMIFMRPHVLRDAESLTGYSREKYRYMRGEQILNTNDADAILKKLDPIGLSLGLESYFPSSGKRVGKLLEEQNN